MSKNDGGQAYPFEQITKRQSGLPVEWKNHNGMTLRDYFAAKALPTAFKYCDGGYCGEDWNNETLASVCYEIADAMIKARNQK